MHEVEEEDSKIIDAPIETKENESLPPQSQPISSQSGADVGTIISIVVSLILILILMGLLGGFLFIYGRSNPGGVAERIAMRMEANYKRFGGESLDSGGRDVEMDKSEQEKEQQKQSANNNSITVSF